jgi:hypothetical protein
MDIAAQIPPGPVGVIFLDTLNRSIGGSENKDEDMGAYVTSAAALAAQFQCAIIIIHHSGTNENRPRGHTSLTGAVEAQIGVKRDAAGRIIAAVEYMKDGPEEGQVVSKLKVVEVGIDEDGEPITSCVVEHTPGCGCSEAPCLACGSVSLWAPRRTFRLEGQQLAFPRSPARSQPCPTRQPPGNFCQDSGQAA